MAIHTLKKCKPVTKETEIIHPAWDTRKTTVGRKKNSSISRQGLKTFVQT